MTSSGAKATVKSSPFSAKAKHESYADLVMKAVQDLGGKIVSRPAILKYIIATRKEQSENKARVQTLVNKSLKKLLDQQKILMARKPGMKGAGSYRLPPVRSPKAKGADKAGGDRTKSPATKSIASGSKAKVGKKSTKSNASGSKAKVAVVKKSTKGAVTNKKTMKKDAKAVKS